MAKIRKLPSGNYQIRIVVGHGKDGRPIQKSFTHYDKTKLRAIAAEYATSHGNAVRRYTVREAIDAFLSAKTPVLSPSTVRAYTSLSKTLKAQHAAFCGLYVDAVNGRDLQTLINSLVITGKSPKTVRNVHGFLSAVFKFAGERLPVANLPQKVKPDIHIPDAATVKRLHVAAQATPLEIPLALATFGLRRSEICALSVGDLDGNRLTIHAAAVYGQDKALHVKTTKTYASTRTILIPDELADKIRKQGYITEYTPAALTHAFTRFAAANGVNCRLHDLRHFFVSYCHNVLHLSDAQIQTLTGHKTSVVLRGTYLHSMGDEQTGRIVAGNLQSIMSNTVL